MTENFWPIWPKADFDKVKPERGVDSLTVPDSNFDPLRFVDDVAPEASPTAPVTPTTEG